MNITQLLSMMQMMNGNGKIPDKDELEKKMNNLSPEEKDKINTIFNSPEVQEAVKSNDLSKIIAAVQAKSKET